MVRRQSEGILCALFFLSAFIFLALNDSGLLTGPGLIIAVIAVYFSLKGRYRYSSCLGILTAAGSYWAQFITVFCLYCTLAATAFLMGGLLSLMFSKSENIRFNLSLLGVSILGLMLMVITIPQYEQRPIVAQAVAAYENTPESTQKSTGAEKAMLYISPTCKSCKSVIDQFIKEDPQGIYWQPVVVPPVLLAQGESWLRDKGYTGEITSAFDSPTDYVPVMQINGQVFRGNELTLQKVKPN